MKTKVYLVKNILGMHDVYADKKKAQEAYNDALYQVYNENARYTDNIFITDILENNCDECNRFCSYKIRSKTSDSYCRYDDIFLYEKEII